MDDAVTPRLPEDILYGVAYYDEYMPTDRIDTDVEMLQAAHLNTVRIAESTWSTCEPQPGVFDFNHVDRALETMAAGGRYVIVGTPTYAVPSWLVQSYPEVLATTSAGPGRYGARQIMNIAHPAFRFHAERVIRELVSRTAQHPAVIGFQLDNESKYYDTASLDIQRGFVKWLREKFEDDLSALNARFGLDYWSNRIDAWEDFPDVLGTINGSLACAFDEYRRTLVDDYLAWQAKIVREYTRDDQFLTHNFDFDWGPGWSYGVQPAVNHFHAAKAVDVAGVDIYHPTEDDLTGKEIAFGGDITRSIKGGKNYLVLETEAQGQMGWLPFPGQLRLQAYSHLAAGADGVMYWHWHSIHNSFETYWKGLLSQDFEPTATYRESCRIGAELAEHSATLKGLRKTPNVAIMISNEAYSALQWFGIETGFPRAFFPSIGYNDVFRWVYDALFDLNLEVDIVSVEETDPGRYEMLVVPALYAAPAEVSERLASYVEAGGHLVATFRSFVADEWVKVRHEPAPYGRTEVFGVTYNEFTKPGRATLAPAGLEVGEADLAAGAIIELLRPSSAETLASYESPAWGEYAAITRNSYGKGSATYVATKTSADVLKAVLTAVAKDAGAWEWPSDLAGQISARRGVNARGNEVTYLLNYSPDEVSVTLPVGGTSVLNDTTVTEGDSITVGAWDLVVLEGGQEA